VATVVLWRYSVEESEQIAIVFQYAKVMSNSGAKAM